MYELKNGSSRLVYTLYRHSDDRTIKILAQILNYYPQQLSQDIQALYDYYNSSKLNDDDEEEVYY